MITFEKLQLDGYKTGCLNYPYLKEHCKLIEIDLINNKFLMLIRKKNSKLILLKIYLEQDAQQYISLLRKQNKQI